MTTKQPDTSKPTILKAAVKLANDVGLFQFSRVDVANAASVGESTVSYHFGTMPELRTAIAQHAVDHKMLKILADARAGREKVGVTMSAALRKQIAKYIAG
jgi:AcrR family transcriptional regulator